MEMARAQVAMGDTADERRAQREAGAGEAGIIQGHAGVVILAQRPPFPSHQLEQDVAVDQLGSRLTSAARHAASRVGGLNRRPRGPPQCTWLWPFQHSRVPV
jgi:hypothetical protein